MEANMSKKNILIIHPYNESIDGVGATVIRLLSNIDLNEYNFSILAPAKSNFTNKLKDLGVNRIYTFPLSTIKRTYNPVKILKFFFNWYSSIDKVISIIKQDSIDLVISNTSQVLFGGIAAKKMSVPHITHIHEISFAKPKFVGNLVVKMLSKYSDKILVVASFIKNIIIDFSPLTEPKIEIVYNGLDIEKYLNDYFKINFRQEFNLKPDDIAIGTIGRICDRKGQRLFIEAASKLASNNTNFYFFIIGEPTSAIENKYFEELKEFVAQKILSNYVIFIKTRVDIQNVIEGLNAIVISSKQEAFPNISLEAMAFSKPVIAFDVGGIREQIDDGITGFLVPSQNIDLLANSIEKIARNRDESVKIGKSGQIKVNKLFHIKKTTEATLKIWNSLLRTG